MLRFSLLHFDELSARDVHDVLLLRNIVFVVGQKITSVPEVDGLDPVCSHARAFDGDTLVATARLFTELDPIVIGRVAVHTDFQRRGYGTDLMRFIQEWLAAQTTGPRRAELHAQAYLEEWYTSLGWTRFGEPFIEADIPHVHMRYP